MRRNGHGCTAGLNIESRIKFSVPFRTGPECLPIWPHFERFFPLSVRMRGNGHKTTSGVKFDIRFEIYALDLLYNEKIENYTTI